MMIFKLKKPFWLYELYKKYFSVVRVENTACVSIKVSVGMYTKEKLSISGFI